MNAKMRAAATNEENANRECACLRKFTKNIKRSRVRRFFFTSEEISGRYVLKLCDEEIKFNNKKVSKLYVKIEEFIRVAINIERKLFSRRFLQILGICQYKFLYEISANNG